MSNLQELKTAVLADGIVDAGEVEQLRTAVFADGKVDREEADVLFEINNAVSGKENDPGWQKLFVEAIASHVLDDDGSPGAIDEAEATYLAQKIEGDGQVDDTEKALLSTIKAKATGQIPGALSSLFAKAGIN